ncbi:MAG: bacterial Ig-like domain-containing protein [Lachnospiraceae bacterium]|nr:bacterial Ig-like domain-containing protein [Lachnospiraceae bacterium]
MQSTKKRKSRLCVFWLIAVVVLLGLRGREAEAAKSLASITAVYMGDTVLVGHSIDLEKLTVMGLYTDGSYEKIKEYSLSTSVILNKGDNKIIVTSGGVSGTFIITGKAVSRVSAYYEKSNEIVGDELERDKVIVRAYYSDGTNGTVKDFSLPETVVKKVGVNQFTVEYEGKTATFSVTGREEKKAKSIYARYSGPTVIVGNAPKRENFYVSVVYNDNTIEHITSFTLEPSVIQKEGSNTVLVSYEGLTTEVIIQGLAKTVVSIKAEYVGLPIVVGKAVSTSDIKVTATFNDGSKDEVTNFTLSGSIIYKIGTNLITVHCNSRTAYINVRGVEAEIIDYSSCAQGEIWNGRDYTNVMIAVGKKNDSEKILIEKVDPELVKKAMNRLVQTDRYIAYEVSFEDPEMDALLPMTMKVSVPAGYDKEQFAVFYTPNCKTIMAQLNGEFLKDGTYEFKMFQPGTYIVADCTPLIYVESIKLEEETLILRVGHSYSLDPEILPYTATNKEVNYSSSRPEIVSVSEYGKLKALKTGAAIITVEAQDGSGKKCRLRVNVVEKKGDVA